MLETKFLAGLETRSYSHFLNLTTGLEFLETWLPFEKPMFVRLQSSRCEAHAWDKFLLGVDDNLLMHFATGSPCVVWDTSSRSEMSRALAMGLRLVSYVATARWQCLTHWVGDSRPDIESYLKRDVLPHISKDVKKKFDYFKPFVNRDVESLVLIAMGKPSQHDGDQAYYRDLVGRRLHDRP